jgi:hypothetical protein
LASNALSARWLLGSLFVMISAVAAPVLAADNEIFNLLVERGLEIGTQETIKLPRPVLADGWDAARQRPAIESLLAGRYDWETFTRKSFVSPFLLRISAGEPDSGQVGRRVDLYFVAYGELGSLAGDDYLHQQLDLAASNESGAEGARVRILPQEELAKRALPGERGAVKTRWVAVNSTLLGKVRISVTTKNMMTQTADTVLIASIADRAFDRDAEFPNTWQSITVDDAGRKQTGPPQPFAGLGSYVRATKLAEPAGAIFMEYHVAFAEPREWFHGANLLRSKLPIVVQDMVRKFRRSAMK